MTSVRYVAGIVNYRSYDDLECCLDSLARQSRAPIAVHVLDGDADPRRHAALCDRHPDARIEATPNLGYAAAANRLLAEADCSWPEADYYLLLNPDIELDACFAERLIASMHANSAIALGGGKLLRPGRKLMDSAGIVLPAHRRPRDRGSERPDLGEWDRPEHLFGVSGAAMMLRRAALPDIALAGEIFDEDFFAYHEDTDLSWRAGRLGWQVLYEPAAIAIHRRGWQRSARRAVPLAIRRHSFKNHYLQVIKNEKLSDLALRLPVLIAWEAMRLAFALLRDPAILPAYKQAWTLGGRALLKRRALSTRIAEGSRSARMQATKRKSPPS
jgi:GT2 family glycosyltransferase